MPRPILLACLGALLCGAPPVPARAQACVEPGPLGLVLSGGGAKGLAHVGVLEVLDSLGIHPDLVVGASMGSIVGAMYASGYTPAEIRDEALGLGLEQLFTRTDPRTPRSLGDRRPLVVWEPGAGGFRTGEAGAREAGVNAALNRVMLRGNLAARGNFDSLPIPFRAIATNLTNRAEVTLGGGDLGRAVRASMAVPLVFDPVRLDGRYLIDGGLAANVPIAAARRMGAARVIVSDVGWRPPDSLRAADPFAVADMLVAYLFTQPLDSLGPADRLVRPPVDSFAPLSFAPDKLEDIIRRGHDAAVAAFAANPPCATPAATVAGPVRRRYRVAHVRVGEGSNRDANLLQRQLGLYPGDTLDPVALRERFKALGASDDYQQVWVQPSGSPDSLTLAFSVVPAPSRLVLAGLTYDNDVGGLMWIAAVDRGTLLGGLESSASLVLGELRQEFGIGFRTAAFGRYPRRPVLLGQVAREKVRRFTPSGGAAPDVSTREISGLLGMERRFGWQWLVTIGGLATAWDAPGPDESGALGGLLRLASGPRYRSSGIWAEGTLTNVYVRVAGEARKELPLVAGFRFTPSLRYGWGRDLPLHLTFPLGGADGFPGLNIGELRGDRELFAQALFTHRIAGPLEFRVSAASGQTASGGPTLPRGRWEAGGRAGLGADTPIGPIRVEYGIARGGRNGVFVRLGEWY